MDRLFWRRQAFCQSSSRTERTPMEDTLKKMRAVQVAEKNGPLHLVERDVPEPGRGEVWGKVEACGVCHSDSLAVEGTMPGVPYPIVPGHEIAGRIARSARVSRAGQLANASGWAGSAAPATAVSLAAEATWSAAGTCTSPASTTRRLCRDDGLPCGRAGRHAGRPRRRARRGRAGPSRHPVRCGSRRCPAYAR